LDTKTFADLGLSPKVQAAITAAGYPSPTPIQAAAIPVAVTGRDVLGIAQTGTGKTASFVLPMITRLEAGRARARMPRSLILAPTRELAAQVEQSFEKYGINHKLDVALLIGGVSMDEQVKKLDRGVDVLIATPGRLLDHFQRGRIMLMGVEILVIDEADRMLDMGFIPDIEKICRLLPPRRQTLFFSATMPPEITRLVSQFLKDPVRIEVAKPATTAKTITQRFKFCPDGEDYAKREVLRELIRNGNVKNAIIFCNRKRDVAVLYKSLSKHGFNAGALHGDMDQSARMETLDRFRSGEIMLLAASDVAARGLDIPDVSHVFNFDLPWAADDYVHRIGRTGRAGREGYSASLVSAEDLKLLKDIEKITGESAIWLGEAPTEEDYAQGGKRRRGRSGRGNDRASARGGRREGGREGAREARHGHKEGHSPQRAEEAADRNARSRDRSQPVEQNHKPEVREQPRNATHARTSHRHAEHSVEKADRGGSRQGRERNAEVNAKPQRERRPDSWADAPARPEGKKPLDTPRAPQAKPAAQPQSGSKVGFAENIPAFLRKPPRPLKQPPGGR
jgi:superfamily II DNA/RNA helicase